MAPAAPADTIVDVVPLFSDEGGDASSTAAGAALAASLREHGYFHARNWCADVPALEEAYRAGRMLSALPPAERERIHKPTSGTQGEHGKGGFKGLLEEPSCERNLSFAD